MVRLVQQWLLLLHFEISVFKQFITESNRDVLHDNAYVVLIMQLRVNSKEVNFVKCNRVASEVELIFFVKSVP